MKHFRDVVIALAAGAALFAVGCGQKPAATSDAAPPSTAQPEQGGAAQDKKPDAFGGGAAAHPGTAGDKRAAADHKPASGSALTPAGRESAPPPKPVEIVLPEGTVLSVRTTTALSTKTVATGDAFTGSLMSDLVHNGATIAPKGATVRGKVVESDPGGRVKGVASLAVRITELEVDGKTVPVSTDTVAREAATTKKKDAVKVGIGSGIGAAIGAIAGGGKGAAIGAAAGAGAGGAAVMATRGDPAVIPAESALTFHLSAPARVR